MKIKTGKDSTKKAISVIKEGGILVFPTDTVYGIGCDPYNKNAIKRIYKAKNRSSKKNLPVLVDSIDTASQIAIFDKNSKKLAEKIWPGPLTLILQLKDKKIAESMQLSKKIAIRVPKNKLLQDILSECKFIVGTSANISGEDSFVNPKNCSEKLDYDLFIDGGIIESHGESTVVEFTDKEMIIHREGILSRQDILELL